jgi:hypothetical protein
MLQHSYVCATGVDDPQWLSACNVACLLGESRERRGSIFYLFLFIVTSAQLRSRCDVWLAVKASLQTVHHVLHAASESGS